MSIYDISKHSRNKYITDLIKSCETVENINHQEQLVIDNAIMVLADDNTIDDWEKWFELEKQPTWTLQDRIDRLVYTFNSRGFFTPKFLKEQALIFTNGEIEIEEKIPQYHFIVQFTSVIGTPPNIDNFKRMIEINKPAHLTFEIKYRYRIWGELKIKKWEDLAPYTWQEIKERSDV